MAGAGYEGVVVTVLEAERLVGLRGGRRALEIGIGADQLDRPAELARARPQIEGERLGIDGGFVLGSADERIAVAVQALAQDRARHQFVRARHPALGCARLAIVRSELLHRSKAPAAAERPFRELVL